MKTRRLLLLAAAALLVAAIVAAFSATPIGVGTGLASSLGAGPGSTVSCQQVRTTVTLVAVASRIGTTLVWSYSPSAVDYSSTSYENETSVAEPVGTVVTTTHTESTFSSNVISEWTGVACTYVK